MQIITGRERQRSWSEGQKRAIVAAVFAPAAIVTDVARRAEICAFQIYRWRHETRCTKRAFSEVVIAHIDDRGNDGAALGPAPAIKVEFADKARLRIAALTSPELAAAVRACFDDPDALWCAGVAGAEDFSAISLHSLIAPVTSAPSMGLASDATATTAKVRLDAGKAARFSASARSTACFDSPAVRDAVAADAQKSDPDFS